MNESNNDEAVYRTAQATPCLLNIPTKKQQYEILIFRNGPGRKKGILRIGYDSDNDNLLRYNYQNISI